MCTPASAGLKSGLTLSHGMRERYEWLAVVGAVARARINLMEMTRNGAYNGLLWLWVLLALDETTAKNTSLAVR